MEIKEQELNEIKDFESLQIGDTLVIMWDKTTRDGANKEVKSPMLTQIKELKKSQHEIILKEPNNLYFNYNMYLNPKEQGYSRCRYVAKVLVKDV